MLPNESAVNSGPLTVGSMTLIFSAAEVNKFSHSYYLVLMKNKIALVTGASFGNWKSLRANPCQIGL